MATAALAPNARITARVTASVQSVLEEAAAFLGVPLHSFIVSAAVEKASDVLAAERRIKLGRQDAEFLARVMENPPEPAAALLAAAKKHRQMIRA